MRKSNCRIINGLQASLQWRGRSTGTGLGRAPEVISWCGAGTSTGAQNPLRRDPLGKSWLPSCGGGQVNQSLHRAKKQQTSTEVCCLEAAEAVSLVPPATRTCACPCPASTQPEAPAAPGPRPVQVIDSSCTSVLLPEMPYFLYLSTNCLGS